jgi:alginate O-acetyltransferase complex protein AlgI
MLDRVFLLSFLNRTNVYISNILTVFIVMFGWVIFRSPSLELIANYFRALLNPLSNTESNLAPGNVVLVAAIVGAVLCALPRLPFYPRLEELYRSNEILKAAASVTGAGLFVLACGRILGTSLQSFLYFRF